VDDAMRWAKDGGGLALTGGRHRGSGPRAAGACPFKTEEKEVSTSRPYDTVPGF
jgi:hypothetical protein